MNPHSPPDQLLGATLTIWLPQPYEEKSVPKPVGDNPQLLSSPVVTLHLGTENSENYLPGPDPSANGPPMESLSVSGSTPLLRGPKPNLAPSSPVSVPSP